MSELLDSYMTTREAMELLSLSKTQVSRLCATNRIAGAIKKGYSWLIPRESVEVYKYIKRKGYKKRQKKEG